MAGHDSVERVSLAQARALLARNIPTLGVERIATEQAAGRITAEPVFARLPSPHYRAAAMDGIAVRTADTLASADGTAVSLAVFEESGPAPEHRRVCRVVDTGNPLPDWADAVVRIEEVRATGSGFEIRSAVAPGRDVRGIGEDILAGSLLLGPGRAIRAVDVGALLATGISDVVVRCRPRIVVLATGGEVIEPLADDEQPRPGQVIEFNSRMLSVYGAKWGATVEYAGRVTDAATVLADRIRTELSRSDLLCVIAGSSAGRKDQTIPALQACGEILFRGVDVAPGRPAAAARVDGKLALAVPGYPVSAVVAYRELLKPALDAALARVPIAPRSVRAIVARDLPSRLGVEELVRVCLAFAGDDLVAAPLARGAGSIGSLMRAHGWVRIGPACEGLAAGSSTDVELLDDESDPRAALVVAGNADRAAAALERAIADTGKPIDVRYLGRADHDAVAAIAAREAHVAFLPHIPQPSVPPHAVVYVLRTADGTEKAAVVLSGALCESRWRDTVCAAVESVAFTRRLEEAVGERVQAVRRA